MAEIPGDTVEAAAKALVVPLTPFGQRCLLNRRERLDAAEAALGTALPLLRRQIADEIDAVERDMADLEQAGSPSTAVAMLAVGARDLSEVRRGVRAAARIVRGDGAQLASDRARGLWVCPDCAFAFDAVHCDEGGGYSCPMCELRQCEGDLGVAVREAQAARAALAAVERLIAPETEMGIALAHGGGRLFAEKDIRAALAGEVAW
jgi:hypothetical protein